MDYKTINLKFGSVRFYENNGQTLYVYSTNDPLVDQVILVKKDDILVSIEAPLFINNVSEFNEFIASLKTKENYLLLVDHVAPSNYFKEAKLCSTKEAIKALRGGQPKGLFDGFVKTFAGQISPELRDDYNEVPSKLNFNGIELTCLAKGDEFDVIMPNFNAVYTHMLGHDVHSIIAGDAHADMIVQELEGFVKEGFELILTSHYEPETIEDVKTKIAYVKNIKSLAKKAANRNDFVELVKAEYPEYSGLNYLDITASAYFPN